MVFAGGIRIWPVMIAVILGRRGSLRKDLVFELATHDPLLGLDSGHATDLLHKKSFVTSVTTIGMAHPILDGHALKATLIYKYTKKL